MLLPPLQLGSLSRVPLLPRVQLRRRRRFRRLRRATAAAAVSTAAATVAADRGDGTRDACGLDATLGRPDGVAGRVDREPELPRRGELLSQLQLRRLQRALQLRTALELTRPLGKGLVA